MTAPSGKLQPFVGKALYLTPEPKAELLTQGKKRYEYIASTMADECL